jgi:EF-hand domain pair
LASVFRAKRKPVRVKKARQEQEIGVPVLIQSGPDTLQADRRKNLHHRNSFVGIGLVIGLALATTSCAFAQSAIRPDAMLNNGPPTWDANHDGIYTCDEWKSFMDRLFKSADKNNDGSLSPAEFETVRKAEPSLAEAGFGYYDENQDGKISRKEFVEKPSAFILRFDLNGDCRVTPEEIRTATAPKTDPRAPQERPRDRFH